MRKANVKEGGKSKQRRQNKGLGKDLKKERDKETETSYLAPKCITCDGVSVNDIRL